MLCPIWGPLQAATLTLLLTPVQIIVPMVVTKYVQSCNNFFYLIRFFRFLSPILLAS